jgi:hypothetical protein
VSEYDHEAAIRRRHWATGAGGQWGGGEIIQGVAIVCDGFQIAVLNNWVEYKKK